MKSLKLVCLLALAGVGSTAVAQITVSGDFAAGTGQLAIQQDLVFTIPSAVTSGSGYLLVFEGMNKGPDASQTEMISYEGSWQRSINGGPDSTVSAASGYFVFADRVGGAGFYGDITDHDSYLIIGDSLQSFSYAAATTFTIRATTFTFEPKTSSIFDPDAIGAFSGNVFLVKYADGLRFTDKLAISAVPEPSTYALGGGLAALGLTLWWRRRRAAS